MTASPFLLVPCVVVVFAGGVLYDSNWNASKREFWYGALINALTDFTGRQSLSWLRLGMA